MWQEARKNEKKIRSLMVDHKRRAERRKDFYERVRRDPVQFLQVHASAVRIHIDSAISAAAENCLVPWRGDRSQLIDRFDARAHLEDLSSLRPVTSSSAGANQASSTESRTESRVNYERWKNLVQYEFSGLSETRVLQQITTEERDLSSTLHPETKFQHQQNQSLKKKTAPIKAAIGYNYDTIVQASTASSQHANEGAHSSSSDESDIELQHDCPSLDLSACSAEQVLKLNSIAHKYAITSDDYAKFLQEDKEEAERIQLAKDIENEKSMFSGRKSRRQRKALKERRMLVIHSSHPKQSESAPLSKQSADSDSSSSDSDQATTRVSKSEFITSFGGSSSDESERRPVKLSAKGKYSNSDTRRNVHDSISRHYVDDRHGRDGRAERQVSSRRRSRDSDRMGEKRARSRSKERKSHHYSKARHRNRSRSRSRSHSSSRRRRSRSQSVDSFGRVRRSRNSTSPRDAAQKSVNSRSETRTAVQNDRLAEVTVPEPPAEAPPPLKRYYRPDLESGPSGSDSEKDEKGSCVRQATASYAPPAPVAHKDHKVTSSSLSHSSSSKSSHIHKMLMRKTRAQIESHYRKDKLMMEEKKKDQERKDFPPARRHDHSSAHRRRSSSSSS